jgi:hypothetical protein
MIQSRSKHIYIFFFFFLHLYRITFDDLGFGSPLCVRAKKFLLWCIVRLEDAVGLTWVVLTDARRGARVPSSVD